MSVPLLPNSNELQHIRIRDAIRRLDAHSHLPITSNLAHELVADLFDAVVPHLELERQLLARISPLNEHWGSYEQHSVMVMEAVVKLCGKAMSNCTESIGATLPELRRLIDEHITHPIHVVLVNR